MAKNLTAMAMQLQGEGFGVLPLVTAKIIVGI